ncbi:MAG: UDP-glucose/GDP-mannose dehydrogenase family protein [Ignavibacteriae bacterium]|nr:UDP-glucose/GDP-mannose dehydrogenase family protein [Ignavibacteriota bacterium]
MNISIFGLGYVGSVSLGCIAKFGHNVIGVDINRKKVDLIKKGYSPIIEPGLNELISSGVKRKVITTTSDYRYAVKSSDITFVCIGTPGMKNGNLNLKSLYNSLRQIAEGLQYKKNYHPIVIRSTVIPGSYNKIVGTVEKYSCKKSGNDFSVIINPEFLREGSAVSDFLNPPLNVIGSGCRKSAEALKKFYRFNKAKTYIVSENTAEMIKLVNNSFHSLKIAFANELGNLFGKLGIDEKEIMNVFLKDKKLNISDAYLKPGFAFGGSCLPKDVKALNKFAKDNLLRLPLISNIIDSNELQKQIAFNRIAFFKKKNIGIWGLSFKSGTDDMRGSPILDVINMLLKNNFKVRLFDQNVVFKKIIGANKIYLKKKLPGAEELFEKDFNNLLKYSDVIVVNSAEKKFARKLMDCKKLIILDLINIPELYGHPNYNSLTG